MSSSTVSTPAVSSSSVRFTGRVKWFNNKAGYGFVTITDGDKSGTDVFVHHSSINVDSEQYKYLVQGEYIDFNLNDTNGVGEHQFQAGEVCGIKGGKLMCETRHECRVTRSQYRVSNEPIESTERVKMSRAVANPKEQYSQRHPKARGQGPREEAPEWNYIAKNKKPTEPEQITYQTSSGRGRGSGSGSGSGSGRGRGRPSTAGRCEGKSK